ncbi:MAG TPA: glycosyltransferase [Nevskiaceae bacterium]|nr:glycosyltransferase [Nevskiaceae bacterium]
MTDAPLHIAFYCNLMGWPKRSHGGVRQWVLALANGLVASGYRVDVLSEALPGHFKDEALLDPRVRRVMLGIGFCARWRLRSYILNHPGIRLVSALNHYNIHAARLKEQLGKRVHVTLTQHEHLSAEGRWLHPVPYRRLTHYVQRHFNAADAVVAVSESVASDLRSCWGVNPNRLHAIYNPAWRVSFAEEARTPVNCPWVADKSVPLVVAAGRLHYVKGFDILVDAFACVYRETGAHLVILGEGKRRKQLEAQVRRLGLVDAVALPGRVVSIAPWLAASDAFVVSSRTEACPTVVVEALALGCKIVCSRCPGGAEELLEGGRWGTLVTPEDPRALSTAILDAIRAPVRDSASLRSRAREFSLERALDRYLAVWEVPAT